MEYYEVYKDRPIKPLFGNYIRVREKYIKEAIKQRLMMKVWIKDRGFTFIYPKEWRKTGEKFKQIFNFQDRPMVLWGNYFKKIEKPKIGFEKIKADYYTYLAY